MKKYAEMDSTELEKEKKIQEIKGEKADRVGKYILIGAVSAALIGSTGLAIYAGLKNTGAPETGSGFGGSTDKFLNEWE